MLVILMENQMLAPQRVCQGCLLASSTGQPRWNDGELRCGHPVRKPTENLPDRYECQMGFTIANIK
ncbi:MULTISPECIES: hypothetical protein [Microcoleus]|jgi:hypothetical protein|uniref:Uncharacterized protein n=1 Tax=Microcoleus anatoxicus PTRS2 TaxID=2705321 RepID=A0ABU8YI27_9CYAN|nr:MAG: hypothetical protein EA000_20070 [Oscillatoriales cyanobacterium]TAD94525.1 MAG: hypothetical protein EAZ98_18970 [Oscillatoriales cyanobacterium]TAE02989.1 MAG: hypothetical protein EAZ96_14305 [Oscillatoriales cyanobacterium]TAF04152.1 MAG: hypothetical protein EAZ78_10050 [Oscillatoriales cyanobacterium]TAF38357.1 MAG: hypothetical protein EAZ68_12895 [Oscillatoriales cyanobacterium]